MEHKLKKPLVYNFKAAGPQIAYLALVSEALNMNKSAIIGTQWGQTLGKDRRVSCVIY